MASTSASGQIPGTGTKKHPLIHDQLQQKFPDPNNAFSIDRTFSATSTDIQPSFDVFDDEEGEDDSNSSSGRRDLKKKGGKTKSGEPSSSHNRAEMYRKGMAFQRLNRRNDIQDKFSNSVKPKCGHNSYYNGGKTSTGNFNGNNITSRQDMKSGRGHHEEFGDRRKNKDYYMEEEEDSIGVPSDIIGMLDSEVNEEDEERNKGRGGAGNSDLGLSNNNNSNTAALDNKDNINARGTIDGFHNANQKGCISGGGGDDGNGNDGDNRGNSDFSYKDGYSRRGQNSALRSSIISDGRFGSVNSVSSSFNSAAAAAISTSSGNKFGRGIHINGGGGVMGGNNDILNERLERFHRYTRGPYAPLDRCNSTSVSSAHSSTITQHYYPEGGWGYVVLAVAAICHALMCGLHLSAGVFILEILGRFKEDLVLSSVWLVSFSMGTSLFLSPIWVSICTRRSTRLTAVFGGLVTSLACLFTSFASQFHQTFISFGIILSIGIGLSRDASYLMVGQYFKRRRYFVEVFLVAASGLGILVMTLIVHSAISGLGWRFGLQALTGGIFSTFFLGTCYRSASLYHPQRRAILHLKNQKRKIKEKGKRNDRPPFFDYSCLSSRSIQLLILSTTFTAFGCYSPLFHLALDCTKVDVPITQVIYLYVYIGAGWILGSCLFGMTIVQRNEDCRISKPYLLQGSTLIIAGTLFALATFYEFQGLGSFCWIYGFGLGSYNYVLKAWTYEKTRAKNFSRAWSFVQCAQGLGCIFGVPATGYMNYYAGWRTGYFMSSASVLFSALIMFCCGMKRRGIMRNKSGTSSMKTCETFDSSGMQSPTVRRISFTFPDEPISPRLNSKGSNRSTSSSSFAGGINNFMKNSGITPEKLSGGSGNINSGGGGSVNNFALTHHQQQPLLLQEQPQARTPNELTCISEEGALEPHGPV